MRHINPEDFYQGFVLETTIEDDVQYMIKMGKERGPQTGQKMRFGDEVIDAWVVFHEIYEVDNMTEDMRNPRIFERRAFDDLKVKYEYLPHLTLVETKMMKDVSHDNEIFREYFRIAFYYCHGEILLLMEEKPHLFV